MKCANTGWHFLTEHTYGEDNVGTETRPVKGDYRESRQYSPNGPVIVHEMYWGSGHWKIYCVESFSDPKKPGENNSTEMRLIKPGDPDYNPKKEESHFNNKLKDVMVDGLNFRRQ